MRTWLAPTAVALCLLTLPLGAEGPDNAGYEIQIDNVKPVERDRQLFITVQFRIKRLGGDALITDLADEIVVSEDGQRVAGLELKRPSSDPLTTVLALDTSGSMRENNKMAEAQAAARLFLERLSPKANSGLILFDHRMRVEVSPAAEPYDAELWKQHRSRLQEEIAYIEPRGGTAYLDATSHALHMLDDRKGRKAVVLMTDGVDLNSKSKLPDVVGEAVAARVPVYTIGVGEPGKNEPVTTVLVLDRSGSMNDPASAGDRKSKIEALREASVEFVELMRPSARTTLLPFNHALDSPEPFTNDKPDLQRRINRLNAIGGTRLFDAIQLALQKVSREARDGKRALVVLTDGMDNDSRTATESSVISMASDLNIPLHTLGLGVDRELNEEPLKRMARLTKGSYHHVTSSKELYDVFEDLSIQLHDDGCDEVSLRRLAEETGGKYYLARDVSNLRLYYQELADELQSTYTVTFPSRRSSYDGTPRGIDISVWRNGARISNVAQDQYNRHGVVVPEMDARVYLVLLAVLGGMLLAPTGLRRLHRLYGRT